MHRNVGDSLDAARLARHVDRAWGDEIVPALVEYIRIPNKSPAFDPDWAAHGYMEDAVRLLERWARGTVAAIPDARLDVVRLEGRTPIIVIEIPGQVDDTVVLYGHLDKQPEMTGWAEGLGPWEPVIKDDKLYGRGGADDGYSLFGALTAITALRDQGAPHARCVVLIEACEESGSYDLPFYVDHLSERIGNPSLVVCLDSGCGNYDQLWLTTSLRGMVGGSLRVRVLDEGVHSGDASGIVPSSFRILRGLLSRIEDEATGAIKVDDLSTPIPPERLAQAKAAAEALGDQVWAKFPFAPGVTPIAENLTELVLNRTWRPTLSVTGLGGAPKPINAGNVLRPYTEAKLSIRVPPTIDALEAGERIKRTLEADPPYGAEVRFELEHAASGWNAPKLASWLESAVHHASDLAFGRQAAMMGEGGSIPFMAMLGEKFPKAQFVVTGVLGPHSNAHGPNEFLHLAYARRITIAIAVILAHHASASAPG